jgi:hypothetical protein
LFGPNLAYGGLSKNIFTAHDRQIIFYKYVTIYLPVLVKKKDKNAIAASLFKCHYHPLLFAYNDSVALYHGRGLFLMPELPGTVAV